MNVSVKKYRAQVLRKLPCFQKSKKKLEAKLDKALRNYADENSEPSLEELTCAFGSPEEIAKTLLSEVPQEKQRQYKTLRKIVQIAGSILIVVILVFATYVFFLKEIPMNVVFEDEDFGTEYVPEWTEN